MIFQTSFHDASPLRDNNIAQAITKRKMGSQNGYQYIALGVGLVFCKKTIF
jgi:hypothetical protein